MPVVGVGDPSELPLESGPWKAGLGPVRFRSLGAGGGKLEHGEEILAEPARLMQYGCRAKH